MTILLPHQFVKDGYAQSMYVRSYNDYRNIRLYVYFQRYKKLLASEQPHTNFRYDGIYTDGPTNEPNVLSLRILSNLKIRRSGAWDDNDNNAYTK